MYHNDDTSEIKNMVLDLQLPLPEQKAAAVLRKQIVHHLQQHRPAVGSPLFTEAQLVERTGLSRSTIRRALSPLESAGWIERQQGRGTFVGPRVDMALDLRHDFGTPNLAARSSEDDLDPADTKFGSSISDTSFTSTSHRLLRLAVVTVRLHARQPDPYSAGVLRGLDDAADAGQLSLELFGVSADSPDTFIRRLRRSQPDVIALLAPRARIGFVVGVAMMLKVPVIGTGDSAIAMGLPAVSYDDVQAADEAVQHLLRNGHRRIALIQQESNQQYVLRRRRGFWNAIENAGLPRDQNLELWIPEWNALHEESPARLVQQVRDFLRQHQPTAVLLSENKLVSLLGPLVRDGQVRVPQDLSVIAFDQFYADYTAWMGAGKPTVVELPLEQVGRRLGELAAEVVAGRPPAQPWREPCTFVAGTWVRNITSSSSISSDH